MFPCFPGPLTDNGRGRGIGRRLQYEDVGDDAQWTLHLNGRDNNIRSGPSVDVKWGLKS